MKMAKASKADLDMAVDLVAAFDSLTRRWAPSFPLGCGDGDPDADDDFDRDDDQHCGRALRYLLDLVDRGSLFRVIFGMSVLLDPRNKCVDPDADTLEHHPALVAALAGQPAFTDQQLIAAGRAWMAKVADGKLSEALDDMRQALSALPPQRCPRCGAGVSRHGEVTRCTRCSWLVKAHGAICGADSEGGEV